MQGLYIHIPFCKSRCIYCDFYSTTSTTDKQTPFINAIEGEIRSRAGYLATNELDSVYIGGGTPSVLTHNNIERLFSVIRQHFSIKPGAEITIEANPNDITPELADLLASLSVNRVSMGVQTFDPDMLKLLRRRHTPQQADEAVGTLRSAGINDISIDLIYGLPNQSLGQWQQDLMHALQLPVTHLSAYALMYEEGTELYSMREKGLISEADDELSLAMYRTLMHAASANGFIHYEISNFSLPHHQARHNTGYWTGMHYLGLGPGAHSCNGHSRHANNPDLHAYINARGDVDKFQLAEQEELTPQILMEESLLTSLRTAQGLDLRHFTNQFGLDATRRLLTRALPYINNKQLAILPTAPASFCQPPSSATIPSLAPAPLGTKDTPALNQGDLTLTQGNLALTTDGIFVSDDIISSLFD